MKNKLDWAWLLFFGSLWGISEVAGGGILSGMGIPRSSVLLSAWALFLLAAARGAVNRPGTSTLVGGIATAFKLINASPFICHLLAIFLLGVAFDMAATLFMKKDPRRIGSAALTGAAAAWGGYTLFALIITYVIRYSFWVEAGWSRVSDHIFVGGVMAAVLAAVLAPLGARVGLGSGVFSRRRPAWSAAGALAGVAIFWFVGRLAG